MPQLVKGGKYIYGWTSIRTDRRIRIPAEAFLEYHFSVGDTIILMSGSKTSGGFSMNKPERLKASKIGQPLLSLIDHPEQSHAMLSSGSQQIVSGGKVVSFITLDDDLSFRLPDELIETLGLTVGSKLLAGRGSGLGLAFIARGRICEEALRHPGLPFT